MWGLQTHWTTYLLKIWVSLLTSRNVIHFNWKTICPLQEEKAQVIQTSLFVAGLNTLLQSIFGTRLPAVIGGSYTFVAPTISIILSGQWNDEDPVSVSVLKHQSFSLYSLDHLVNLLVDCQGQKLRYWLTYILKGQLPKSFSKS